MVTYNINQYIQELDRRLKRLEDAVDKSVQSAASTILAESTVRIFSKGQAPDGSKIGEYSTKPMVVRTDKQGNSKSSPVQLKPVTFHPYRAETRQRTGAKGFYGKDYAGGYKQFKQDIGRGSEVNFRLFGDLQLDYANSLSKIGNRYVAGVKRVNNGNKVRGLMSRFGEDVFDHSESERAEYRRLLGAELRRYLSGEA